MGKIPILTSIFFKWVGSTTNQMTSLQQVGGKSSLEVCLGEGEVGDWNYPPNPRMPVTTRDDIPCLVGNPELNLYL